MKISLNELKSIISRAVDKKINETISSGDIGPNWAELKYQFAKGRLDGSWRIIMTAMEETGGNPDRALSLLKASIFKLESKMPPKPEHPPEEMASTEELSDFSKLL